MHLQGENRCLDVQYGKCQCKENAFLHFQETNLCVPQKQPLEFLWLTGWEVVTARQASGVFQFKQQMAGGAQRQLSAERLLRAG